jgi:hypothetical protein
MRSMYRLVARTAAIALALAAGGAGAGVVPRARAGEPAQAAAGPRGALLERVVAVVRAPGSSQPRLITLTRLEEESRIALVSRGGVLAASQRLDADALRAGLEWLIDQTLLYEEASRLQVFEPEPAEVTSELLRFQARFASPEAYRSFLGATELAEEDVAAALRRTLRVKRYVESRAARAARVPEEEVEAFLAAQPAELAGRDPAQARGAVRQRLTDERVTAEVKALVRDLRERSEVRVVGELEGRGS